MQYGGDRSKFISNYNLANRYSKLDSFERAMQIYNMVDTMAEQLNIAVFKDAVLLSKGRLYTQMEKPAAAIPLLRKAVANTRASGNRRGYLTAQTNLGNALNAVGEYEESVEILSATYEGLIQDGFQQLAQNCRKALAEAFYRTGKGIQAYQLLDEYRMVEDSIKGAATSKTINELEIQYQTAEKENQLLQQEIEIAEKTGQRNYLLMLATMLMLSAVLIYYFFKQQNDKNKMIAAKERQIQTQKIEKLENEKKILAMESMIEGQESERSRIAKDCMMDLGYCFRRFDVRYKMFKKKYKS